MKKNPFRRIALLLAVCMALPLAGCGKNSGDAQQISGKVYVPQFVDCKADNIDYVNQGCSDGQYVYFTADVRGEEKEEIWTDDETGETESYTYFETETGLFRAALDSGETTQLENYVLPEIPEGEDGNAYLSRIEIGENGTLWVTEGVTVYKYDLPEGFDEEADADNKWQYQTDYEEIMIRRQLDSTGTELDRIDISSDVLVEKLNTDYIGSTSFDRAGNMYICLETKIVVLDRDLTVLFELDGENLWGNLTQMADGSMAMVVSYSDPENNIYGNKLKFIDLDNKTWGAEYEMSTNVYSLIPGGGDYLFYYQNSDSIYGWKAGAAEGEKLFSWLSAGLNRYDIQFFNILSNGQVVAVTQAWDYSGDSEREVTVRIATLTPTDPKDLPEKTTLTLAVNWLSYDMRSRIMEFNQNSDACRIEVVDYSEYVTGEDDSAGLTKLNTEIIAGNVPDLFYTSGLPIDRYASRGILEDLWPYIESDSEIGGRQALMEHVLDAASVDGKLYQAFGGFTICTVAGPAAVTGDRMSWTLADLQDALSAMPEGCTIFGVTDTKDQMLNQVLAMNMYQFVDWDKGSCSFDSDAFKALLAFCNSFPSEINWEELDSMEWESEFARMLSGKQMLSRLYLGSFTYPQVYDKVFSNGGGSFVGYPVEDGSVGSYFSLNTGFAMSSTCKDKDAAWSFIRDVFLPQADKEEVYDEVYDLYYFNGFPINKSDFEKMRESAMRETFFKDENGQPLLNENGEPERIIQDSWYVSDDQRIEIYAAAQSDVDRVMALYESVEAVEGYDTSIYHIISEQIGAYFAGDKDLDATASEIQNRVHLYMGENM